jgi:hypothetical protein
MTADTPATPATTPPRRQFTIRSLLLLTTFVAILCSFALCTHWSVAVTLGTIVLLAWIAGRFVTGAVVRNLLVCAGASIIMCALEYLYRRCGVSGGVAYEAMFWPVLYGALVWANWHLPNENRPPWLKWLGRILVSALLLPLHAMLILAALLRFDIAIGIRIPIS